MQLWNRIDDKYKNGDASYKNKGDKEWVWTLVERVREGQNLTKAVLLKANNVWRQYETR